MATDSRTEWVPEWTLAPGAVLVEALADRGMSQAELGRRMARPLKTISEIANGKAAITPDTAIQLERALGISASFWNGLEARYREGLALDRARRELADFEVWARRFPIADMVRRSILPKGRTGSDVVSALLSFFQVSSPAGWEAQWQYVAASYRRPSVIDRSEPALSSWLRWGEIKAADIPSAPFDARRLRSRLRSLPRLSRRAAVPLVIDRLVATLAEAGVVLVILPELEGARVSGVTRWLTKDRVLIQLSLRYRSDDQFWFTLFHEIGHVLSEGRRASYLEDRDPSASYADDSPAEQSADVFARDGLVPRDAYDRFVSVGDFSYRAVAAFADSVEVASGIVVGRLQHDGKLTVGQLNVMKRVYDVVR